MFNKMKGKFNKEPQTILTDMFSGYPNRIILF